MRIASSPLDAEIGASGSPLGGRVAHAATSSAAQTKN
jgi:hypothetical protein